MNCFDELGDVGNCPKTWNKHYSLKRMKFLYGKGNKFEVPLAIYILLNTDVPAVGSRIMIMILSSFMMCVLASIYIIYETLYDFPTVRPQFGT